MTSQVHRSYEVYVRIPPNGSDVRLSLNDDLVATGEHVLVAGDVVPGMDVKLRPTWVTVKVTEVVGQRVVVAGHLVHLVTVVDPKDVVTSEANWGAPLEMPEGGP